jgi:hypothetical protein
LLLTEVTSFVSVLALSVCAVSIWLHILTLGVCVCLSHRSKLYRQTLTAHREKANNGTKLVTSVKNNVCLPDDGPYEVRNMLECILEF